MSARIFAIYLLIQCAASREGYYWKSYEPGSTWSVPTDGFAGGQDNNQNNIYIGQITTWGQTGIYPVTVAIGQKAWTPYAGSQIIVTTPAPTTPAYDPNGGSQGNSGINDNNQNVGPPQGGANIAGFVTNIVRASMNPYIPNAAQYVPAFGQPNVNQGFGGQMTYGNGGASPQNAVAYSGVHQATAQSLLASNQGSEDPVSFMQILCSETPANFKWVPTSSTTLYLLRGTTRIVRGGLDPDNHITYIGRIKHQGNVVIGKVITSDTYNSDMIFVFNNREHKVQTYQILTYSDSNTASG